MHAAKPAKKNVTIEIRLSDEAKSAFMARCSHEDLTVSEAIRAFIDDQLGLPSQRDSRRPASRLALVALLGAALGAGVAAPSLAHSMAPPRAACAQAGASIGVVHAVGTPSS